MQDTDRNAPAIPAAPKHLSPESRHLWAVTLDAYELEPHELKTFRLALEALDRATQARRAIRRLGTTFVDRFDQPRARPEVAIERESSQAWLRLMNALSLPVEEEVSQPRARHGQFAARPGRIARLKAAPEAA